MAEGKHIFNVYAKYAVQQSESVDVPMEINPADYVAATYNVKTNNQESADGFTIKVNGRNADYAVVVENGKAEIPYLPLGKYEISMQAPFYAPYSQTVDYTAAQTLDIELAETITAPFNLEVEANENEDLLGFTVDMKWNRDNGFADSFENYDDFATGQFGGWTTKDLNTAPSYAISLGNQDVTFPGASTTASPVAVAPMVFNPAATEPSMENDANIAAADGSKSVIFISPMNETADKWLISPQIKVGNEYAWTLKAKAYTFFPETIELCLSTTGAEPADFQVIETIKPGYQAWQDYTVDLSAYKDQKVYLGLHYVSDNSFICMVDAFKVANKDGNDAVEVGKVLSYDILLDNELKGNTEQTAFTLTDVQGGEHVVGVKANYTSGASEVTTYPLSLVSGVDGLDAASATGDVITPAGIVVMRNATLKQVRSLTPGIYLFRGHKVVVK